MHYCETCKEVTLHEWNETKDDEGYMCSECSEE